MRTMRVADLHCDTVYRLLEGADLSVHGPRDTHIDIPRMRDGDVGLQVFAAFVPHTTAPNEALALAERKLQAIEKFAGAHPSELALASSGAEIDQAASENRVAIMRSVENGIALEENLGNVTRLRGKGVRSLTNASTSSGFGGRPVSWK